MKEPALKNELGFTIIELLMVVAIMGLIMGAVYSLFSVHRNAAYSQVEVVEEQQNLRIAMDCIARDLRIAGIMMPLGTNPIPAATGSPAFPTYTNDIRINVASSEGRFARVAAQHTVGAIETVIPLAVESPATASSPNIADGFALNDKVRIIRPVSSIQPLTPSPANTPFVVTAVDRAAHTISIGRQDSTPFTTGETVVTGDMIAKVSGATYPETIDYYLVNAGTTVNGITCPNNEKCLVRQVNALAAPAGTADIIATKLSTLTLGYLDDSYTEVSAPSASALESIRAVRVSMRGTTAATAGLSGGGRSREITSIIKLRNRR